MYVRIDNMHGCAIAQRALCELLGRFGALRVITHVMTAASIGASRGGGYARYLESKTVEPERGDDYLTPDGEMTQAPGRWLADPETLERLAVRAGEPVDSKDFIALMEGRHPGTGRWLRPEGAGGGRGGGIDVTFSAPKSVSTVWALGEPVAARTDRAGPRQRGRANGPPPARAGAGRAAPLQRPGR
jgi:TrwC relaxase